METEKLNSIFDSKSIKEEELPITKGKKFIFDTRFKNIVYDKAYLISCIFYKDRIERIFRLKPTSWQIGQMLTTINGFNSSKFSISFFEVKEKDLDNLRPDEPLTRYYKEIIKPIEGKLCIAEIIEGTCTPAQTEIYSFK